MRKEVLSEFRPMIPFSVTPQSYKMVIKGCFLKIEDRPQKEAMINWILRQEEREYETNFKIWQKMRDSGVKMNPPANKALIILN